MQAECDIHHYNQKQRDEWWVHNATSVPRNMLAVSLLQSKIIWDMLVLISWRSRMRRYQYRFSTYKQPRCWKAPFWEKNPAVVFLRDAVVTRGLAQRDILWQGVHIPICVCAFFLCNLITFQVYLQIGSSRVNNFALAFVHPECRLT